MKLTITLGLLSAAIAASAVTTAPANTGQFDTNGLDMNWTVSIDGATPVAVGAPSYGGYYNGAPFTSASAWIGLQGVPTSVYTYTTTFNIDAADLATYSLTGAYSSDNASEIFLNGNDTGMGAPYGNGGSVPGDSYLQAFNLNLKTGFVAGQNTLSFVVRNDASSSSPSSSWANPDPNGLRVEAQAVPEPAPMAALGLGALGFLRRRRKA